ncbi:MAG: DUF1559 domain-containing protein [Planctomycetaceae bacterium]|nr:DUF1559 domain-containing protein [Planctomycetaceae bacterium]
MNGNRQSSESSQEGRWKYLANFLRGVVILMLGYLSILFLTDSFSVKRVDGRYPQAINNAKNLALAQKNYASQSKGSFAPPTYHLADGTPAHGWATRMLPLMDHADLYDQIDFTVPWNHPRNEELMKQEIRSFLIPELSQTTDASGHALIHFTLNSHLFPDNESLTEDEISRADGLGNTILMGEIQQGLPAWGAPGNARDPALGLRPGTNTFGVTDHDGMTVIGFADGRVRYVDNKIDPRILKALATPDGGEEIPEEW